MYVNVISYDTLVLSTLWYYGMVLRLSCFGCWYITVLGCRNYYCYITLAPHYHELLTLYSVHIIVYTH